MIKQKFKKHTSGWVSALVIMCILTIVTWGSVNAGTSLFERFAPTELWFEYGIPPVDYVSNDNEFLIMRSNLTIRTASDIVWKDSLWCNIEDGRTKISTVIWGDYSTTGVKNGTWKYPIKQSDIGYDCQMCGIVKATTSTGKDKVYNYCTKYFKIMEVK